MWFSIIITEDGIVYFSSDEQLLNKLYPIFVTKDWIEISFNEVQLVKWFPIDFIEEGILIEITEIHFEKAKESTEITKEGIVISINKKHL